MAVTFNTVKPVGTPELIPSTPVSTPIAPSKKFVLGSTGLGKFGGNSTQALARSVAVLGGNYDAEGMSIVRNMRVTKLEACEAGRASIVGSIYNLAKPER